MLDFTSAKPDSFVCLCRLDCRNFEPITFEPHSDTFRAVAADSRTVFDPVDLSAGEWFDYDEKESRQVALTEVHFRIASVK